MSLNGNNRAQAVYNAIQSSNPNFSQLSAAEKAALLSALQTVYTADTTYLTTNATIQPGSFGVPVGIPVATTGTAAAQTGATTAPSSVTGVGTLS